jgi:hypothetical protein
MIDVSLAMPLCCWSRLLELIWFSFFFGTSSQLIYSTQFFPRESSRMFYTDLTHFKYSCELLWSYTDLTHFKYSFELFWSYTDLTHFKYSFELFWSYTVWITSNYSCEFFEATHCLDHFKLFLRVFWRYALFGSLHFILANFSKLRTFWITSNYSCEFFFLKLRTVCFIKFYIVDCIYYFSIRIENFTVKVFFYEGPWKKTERRRERRNEFPDQV